MLLTIGLHREFQRVGRDLHVMVRGESGGFVDVTHRCQSADDAQGWALCYRLNAAGHAFYDTARERPAVELLVGEVVFESREVAA